MTFPGDKNKIAAILFKDSNITYHVFCLSLHAGSSKGYKQFIALDTVVCPGNSIEPFHLFHLLNVKFFPISNYF